MCMYIFILFIYTTPIILFQNGNVGQGGNFNAKVSREAVVNRVIPGIIIYILRHYYIYVCA